MRSVGVRFGTMKPARLPSTVYADSVDAALLTRLDAWYAQAAGTESRAFPFEVLTSWVRAMGYEKAVDDLIGSDRGTVG